MKAPTSNVLNLSARTRPERIPEPGAQRGRVYDWERTSDSHINEPRQLTLDALEWSLALAVLERSDLKAVNDLAVKMRQRLAHPSAVAR